MCEPIDTLRPVDASPHHIGGRYHSFYPDGPEKSDSFARIVSAQHAARIKALLDQTGGDIVCGGEVDVDKRYVAPTIVNNVTATDSLMSE